MSQEKFYGKPIILADREMVEEKAGDMIEEAIDKDVAFLVVGDPFGYGFVIHNSSFENVLIFNL